MIKVASLINVFTPTRSKSNILKGHTFVESGSQPWLAYSLIAVNVALLLSYLLGVNARASAGYEIKQLSTQVYELNEAQKDLNLELSEITAISVMSEDFAKQGFVQAGTSQYVTVDSETGTAMK